MEFLKILFLISVGLGIYALFIYYLIKFLEKKCFDRIKQKEEKTKICPECAHFLEDREGAFYCGNCGYMGCPKCGNQMTKISERVCGHADLETFECPNCGDYKEYHSIF